MIYRNALFGHFRGPILYLVVGLLLVLVQIGGVEADV